MDRPNHLRRLRKQLGLTQAEAAALIPTTQANYCRWEIALDDAASPLAARAMEAVAILRRVGVERFGAAWSDAWVDPGVGPGVDLEPALQTDTPLPYRAQTEMQRHVGNTTAR